LTTFSINSFFLVSLSSSFSKQVFKFKYNFFLVLFLWETPSNKYSSGNSSFSSFIGDFTFGFGFGFGFFSGSS
jgi:hypothetical protein